MTHIARAQTPSETIAEAARHSNEGLAHLEARDFPRARASLERAVQLAPGDPAARLAGPELLVHLTLDDGLDREALDALLGRLQRSWADDEVITERVDSIGVRLAKLS